MIAVFIAGFGLGCVLTTSFLGAYLSQPRGRRGIW